MTNRDPALPKGSAVIVDLGSIAPPGAPGAVWSAPHGGDLDANLVRLHSRGSITEHVNDDVDVLIFVQSGRGELTVDGETHRLRRDVLALIPRGARRQIAAGQTGICYLSVHRRRGLLSIAGRPGLTR